MLITIQAKFTTIGTIAWGTNGLVVVGYIPSGRAIQFDSMKEFISVVQEITGWSKWQIIHLLFSTFVRNRSQSPAVMRLVKEVILYEVIEA